MADIQNILLATDLSEESSGSIIHARELAKLFSAKLYILHAYQILPGSEVDLVNIYSIEEGLKSETKKRFREIEAKYFSSKVPNHVFIMKSGPVGFSIREVLSENNIDLLVMGTSHHYGLGKLFENETSRLINKIEVPILAIPKNIPFKSFEKVLFTSDLKKLSTQMDVVTQIVEKHRASIDFVTVEKDRKPLTVNEMITETILEDTFEEPEVEHHFIQGQDVESTILNYAKANHADLLVMTPHHHTLWEKIMQKSITKSLLLDAKLPLLILPE